MDHHLCPKDSKDVSGFDLRRVEVLEGEEAMLLKAGWVFDGPANHKSTEIGKYWINPRSKRRYTQRAAVDIEELRESLNTRSYVDGKSIMEPEPGFGVAGWNCEASERKPPRPHLSKNAGNVVDKPTPAERMRKFRNKQKEI